MKKISQILITMMILYCSSLYAQQIKINGMVFDSKTNLPIKNANVLISPINIGTITDSDGFFSLMFTSSNQENDSLIVKFLGYSDFRIALNQYENGSGIYLEPKILELGETISVSADKINILKQEIPHAKMEIDAEEIERLGSSEISDLFKTVPSVRIEGNDLDGRTIQIRGGNSDEVNVFVDGIRINDLRYDDVADLTLIPTESIEKIQILKGGNMMLLGNGAFGGVINIITKKNFENSYNIKVKGGSYNTKYLLTDINVPISKRLAISYFGQFNTSEPKIEYYTSERYDDKTTNDFIETTKQNHHINLNYLSDDGELNAKFLNYLFKYKKPAWKNSNNNYISSINYKGKLLSITDLDLNANYLNSEDVVSRDPEGNTAYFSTYETHRLNGHLAKKFSFFKTELQFLAEYFHDELKNKSESEVAGFRKPTYYSSIYENRIATAGVFSFKDDLLNNPNLSWKTYLGLRGDFHANGDQDFTHSFGFQLEWKKNNYIFEPYANYGKNVKYPTLLENAYIRDLTDFYHTDSTTTRLKPEYSSSGEIGLNFTFKPISSYYKSMDISFALFSNVTHNKLIKRPFDNLISSSQLGRNVTNGLEGSITFNNIFNQFNIRAFYTGLDIEDPYLYPYKPEVNYSLQLDWLYHKLYLKTIYFYEGESVAWYYDNADQFQTEKISPFYDVDISLGYSFSIYDIKTNLQLSGYNIFDNSGYKYYTLKKKFLQFSVSVKY